MQPAIQPRTRVRTNLRFLRAFLFTALVAAVLPASAAAIHNDDWQDAEAVGTPSRFIVEPLHTSIDSTVQVNEPLSFDGPGFCNNGSIDTESGADLGGSLWYLVTGTGGPVTLSTRRSNFDTILAVYDTSTTPTTANHIRCDDDGNDFDDGESELVFPSVAGRDYLVQVGGFHDADAGTYEVGNVGFDAYRAPANDQRGSATPITAGTAPLFDNFGATSGAEPLKCGTVNYAKTVWFRWVAPFTGDATFTASSPNLDTVLSVFPAGSGTTIGCSDDAVGSGTSSRVPARRVIGGRTYEIQVGGFGTGQGADDEEFNLNVEFVRDFDLDDDGQIPPTDCNDGNPAIKRGAKDVRNGIDDDCDGIVDPDRDEDNSLRPPLGADCNDSNPRVRPGATEVRGNLVDENCDGVRAPFRRIRAEVDFGGEAGRVVIVRFFVVKNLPRRSRVSVVCKAPGGGSCGGGSVRARRGSVRIRGLDGRLAPGSVIQVRVAKRGYIGFFQRVTVRALAAPKYSRPKGACTPVSAGSGRPARGSVDRSRPRSRGASWLRSSPLEWRSRSGARRAAPRKRRSPPPRRPSRSRARRRNRSSSARSAPSRSSSASPSRHRNPWTGPTDDEVVPPSDDALRRAARRAANRPA